MGLVLLAWLTMVFWGVKYSNEEEVDAFSIKNTLILKGVCSIEIMLGHIGITTESIILFPNRKAGILFVGIFFVLSGYGLMYSISNKENYMDNFLKRRLSKILAPAYFVFLIRVIVRSIVDGNINNLINVINVKVFFERTNWYVWELLVLYIMFYICAKVDKSLLKGQYILLTFSLVFICVAFAVGLKNPWYGSTLCFWFGIFYYIKRESFIKFFQKGFAIKVITGSMFLICFCVLFFVKGGIVGNLIARNCASVIFTALVIMCLQKFSIGNGVSVWLGKYSYEIFLFHPWLIGLLRPQIENDVLYAAVVIISTVLVAVVYRSCADSIKRLCKTTK